MSASATEASPRFWTRSSRYWTSRSKFAIAFSFRRRADNNRFWERLVWTRGRTGRGGVPLGKLLNDREHRSRRTF